MAKNPLPPASTTLEVLIDALVALAPPRHVVHVGAGTGLGAVHRWRHHAIATATLVDADARRMAWAVAEHADWRVCEAVLAASAGPMRWHAASNPDESGLVPVDALKPLWPQLRALGAPREVAALPLAALLEDAVAAARRPPPDWLVVDCLGADAVLGGAGPWLDAVEVIVLRWATSPEDRTRALDTDLAGRGFLHLGTDTSRHPLVGHRVYRRDVVAEISRRTAECRSLADRLSAQMQRTLSVEDELLRRLADRDAQSLALTGQLALAEEAQQALRQEAGWRAQAEATLRSDLAQSQAVTATCRDELAATQARLQSVGNELHQAHDQVRAQGQALAAAHQRIDTLAAELDQAKAAKRTQAAAHAAELARLQEAAQVQRAELQTARQTIDQASQAHAQALQALKAQLAQSQSAARAAEQALAQSDERASAAAAALQQARQEADRNAGRTS